jgi:TonB family protein
MAVLRRAAVLHPSPGSLRLLSAVCVGLMMLMLAAAPASCAAPSSDASRTLSREAGPDTHYTPADGRSRQMKDPVRVGVVPWTPKKLRHVAPVYPVEAIAAGVDGIVFVEVRIDADGGVETARVIRSIPLLDQAALDAVQQWRYEPLMFNGTPTAVYMTVTVNFRLPRKR